MKTILILAQGSGYYGCAIVTVRSTLDLVERAMQDAGYDTSKATMADGCVGINGEQSNPDRPQSEGWNMIAMEADGIACARPKVIFDTGHGSNDLRGLEMVLEALKL